MYTRHGHKYFYKYICHFSNVDLPFVHTPILHSTAKYYQPRVAEMCLVVANCMPMNFIYNYRLQQLQLSVRTAIIESNPSSNDRYEDLFRDVVQRGHNSLFLRTIVLLEQNPKKCYTHTLWKGMVDFPHRDHVMRQAVLRRVSGYSVLTHSSNDSKTTDTDVMHVD